MFMVVMPSPASTPGWLAGVRVVAGLLVGAALVAVSVSPAWAGGGDGSASERGAASALVDDLQLGGGATARIDERTGAFALELPVGGLGMRWDSSAADDDRYELGERWSWAGLGHVDVLGGVRATTPTGRVHEVDAAAASGLLGYDLADVRFTQEAGVVPARDDALVPAREGRFTLAELGGVETVFGDDGDPLVRRDAFANRTDWIWDELAPHRLLRVVHAIGLVSTVDRSVPGSILVTTASGGAGTAEQSGTAEQPAPTELSGTIEQSGGRVEAVHDATGGVTRFDYTDDGLLERVSTPTGAVTEVGWRTRPDGTRTAELVRVTDGMTRAPLTVREWRPVHGSASGWPHPQEFTTTVADGTTTVTSTYTPSGLLTERALSVTTASGTSVVELHRLGYPGMEDGVHLDPAELPARFTRPTSSTRTWRTATGAERSVTEHSEYDEFGRVTSSTVEKVDEGDEVDAGAAGDAQADEMPAEPSVIARTEYETTVSGDLRAERIEHRPGNAGATVSERRYSYAPTGELAHIATSTEAGPVGAEQIHDEAGNLIVDVDGTGYAYDAANRQVAETTPDGATIATRYWADGRRAELASSGPCGTATTRFYWDGPTLLNDVHDSGGGGPLAASYLLDASRHARTVTALDSGPAGPRTGAGANRTQYAMHDRHGNVTALTDADGTVTHEYTYDDYGVTSVLRAFDGDDDDASGSRTAPLRWHVGDAQTNPFGYAGEYTDPSGTQHLRSRSYHPGIRQFTTADTEPLHNRYAYADLNPITKVDPTGRSAALDGVDWAAVMQEPWFKILTTVLAVALTVVSFFSMTEPFAAANLGIVVGYWGGMTSLGVQAVGAALLAGDTLNALVPEPFWDDSYAGQVQFAGSVVSSAGAIAGGVFRVVRKIGTDLLRAELLAARTANETLTGEKTALTTQKSLLRATNSKLTADNSRLSGENAKLTEDNAALRRALRELDPNHPLLEYEPPAAPGSGPLPITRQLPAETPASGTDPFAGISGAGSH